MICNFKAQNKICCLENYHSGYHQDDNEFKFADENYPDQNGNGADGYPMNNKSWDKAVQKYLKRTSKTYEEAEEFLKKMESSLLRARRTK
jgi:hypothetical protein